MDDGTEILAASFWENWSFAKELKRMKSSKANSQFQAAEKIRKEWNAKQIADEKAL